jgi:putative endonuclease
MSGHDLPPHLLTGRRAEDLAADYLLTRGLALAERNYRCRWGEIDLVMTEGERTIFVEVRYRRSDHYGGALASIDRRKQRRLLAAARHYMVERRIRGSVRLDVVAVSPYDDGFSIQWVKNAIEAQ